MNTGRADTPMKKREILERILAEWERSPQQRLGQLIVNSTRDFNEENYRCRLFYLEDTELANRLEGKGTHEVTEDEASANLDDLEQIGMGTE